MAIQTLLQRFDSSYAISKTMAPQSGGHTDFRNYCNNISEFETFATTVQEVRQEGLITYELETKKTKRCKKTGTTWIWEEIPTTPEVQALISQIQLTPGPKGDKGDKGDIGLKGPTGTPGTTGAIGPKGATGAIGPTGTQGIQGTQGPKGDTGAPGTPGAKGDVGTQGAQGAKGDKGDTGAKGIQGATGAKGDIGAPGAQGPIGTQGSKGDMGAKGATGDKGLKGDTGTFNPSTSFPEFGTNNKTIVGAVNEINTKITTLLPIKPAGTQPVYLGLINFKELSTIVQSDLTNIVVTNKLQKPETIYKHTTGVAGNKTLVFAYPVSFGNISDITDGAGASLIGNVYKTITKNFSVSGASVLYEICATTVPSMFNNSVIVKWSIN